MLRSALLLLVSGCYITVDKTPGDPPPPLVPNTTFSQPELVEDVIVQDAHAVSDILVVVHNDPDLASEQEMLTENMPHLFDYLWGSGIDWHVGVVSSGLGDPATAGVLLDLGGQPWIDAETPDPLSSLSWGSEELLSQPRDAVYQALEVEGDGANAGFLRDGAPLTVLVLSDGEDSSVMAEVDFVDWLATLGGTYSCLGSGEGTACESTAALTGGVFASGSEMALALEDVGILAAGLTREFPLSVLPDPATLEVEVEDPGGAVYSFYPAELDAEGNIVDGDWAYDEVRNSIRFLEYLPEAGDSVHIRYALASF
jgi:hypothetical protein